MATSPLSLYCQPIEPFNLDTVQPSKPIVIILKTVSLMLMLMIMIMMLLMMMIEKNSNFSLYYTMTLK